MNMKAIWLIVCFSFTTAVFAESNESLLLKLSVACQNAQAEFERVGANTAISPDFVTEYIETINASLDALVASGYLNQAEYNMKNPSEMTEKELDNLSDVLLGFVDKLYKQYGYYSALEMVDMGVYRRISTVRKGDKFSLKVRIPEKYAKELGKAIQPFLQSKPKKKNTPNT